VLHAERRHPRRRRARLGEREDLLDELRDAELETSEALRDEVVVEPGAAHRRHHLVVRSALAFRHLGP
jgi:hypothetical protein